MFYVSMLELEKLSFDLTYWWNVQYDGGIGDPPEDVSLVLGIEDSRQESEFHFYVYFNMELLKINLRAAL